MPDIPARPRPLDQRIRHDWWLFGAIGLVLLVLAAMFSGRLGDSQAYQAQTARLDSLASANARLIDNIRNKFDALPFILAQDTALQQALTQRNPAALAALNLKLERLAQGTGASVIYLIDHQGDTLASSNWQDRDSFVGKNYLFRPYFANALREGQSEYFALGTSSGRPGLYFSRRVDTDPARENGVIAIKLDFGWLEQAWQHAGDILFVTDEHGVIILSSDPDWHFRTLGTLPPALADSLHADLQFGTASLTPLPLVPGTQADLPVLRSGTRESYRQVSQAIPDSTWTLHVLSPTRAMLAASAQTSRLTALLATASLLALAALWLVRRHQRLEREALQAASQTELEQAVEARTRQWHAANQRLEEKMQALEQSRARARDLREQLEQADKLAFLGQISAGVAHEINQPVAAIQTYADNARVYLERTDTEAAARNLTIITDLTHRIGLITGQLRHYARKAGDEPGPVSVRAALDNAMLLLEPRARRQGVTVDIDDTLAPLQVRAAQVRLEQVFINLLRNALDALGPATGGCIVIAASQADGQVRIRIRDNGPGLDADIGRKLFTPFTSSRSDGLGLGLLISRDIIQALGGTLVLEPSSPGQPGACFLITLPEYTA